MKKLICCFVLFFLFPISTKALTLHFFYGDGCPHCAKEELYLEELKETYPELEIMRYETWYQEENSALLEQVKEALGVNNPYIPFTVIGSSSITGFSEATKPSIEEAIKNCEKNACPDLVKQIKEGEPVSIPEEEPDASKDKLISVPFFGTIDAKSFSIPLLAIVMGAIDGFNPCAMWILLFLIGLLLGTKDKKKMWILGLAFLITSGFVYFLFMISWLQVALKMNQVMWIRNAIAVLALFGSIFNLVSFFRPAEAGCHITGGEKRKRLQTKMRTLIKEKKLFIALAGIIGLAFLVNLIELACSAGLPVLFTSVLSMNELSGISYFGAILLYILFYMLDDIIIFAIAMITFELTGISNKYNRYSHLIGGILMLVIGLLLLFAPNILMFG